MSAPVEAAPADLYDYGDDAAPDGPVIAAAFAELDRLLLAAERAIADCNRAEEAFEKAKKVKNDLLTRAIPELLEKMRLDKCTAKCGIEVAVRREIRASLPGHEHAHKRAGAIRWLVEKGHGGVVKNTVRVELERGQDARADELVAELTTRGFAPQAFKDVPHQTLSKLVRELMGEGQVIPKDLFNLFDDRVAKIKRSD